MLLSVLAQVAPTDHPGGDLKPGLEPSQVSPGLIGFLATFVLVAAVVLLIVDFNRRNRRLRYRAEYAEARAAEEHVGGYAHDDAAGPAAQGTSLHGTSPGGGAPEGKAPGDDAADGGRASGSSEGPRPR